MDSMDLLMDLLGGVHMNGKDLSGFGHINDKDLPRNDHINGKDEYNGHVNGKELPINGHIYGKDSCNGYINGKDSCNGHINGKDSCNGHINCKNLLSNGQVNGKNLPSNDKDVQSNGSMIGTDEWNGYMNRKDLPSNGHMNGKDEFSGRMNGKNEYNGHMNENNLPNNSLMNGMDEFNAHINRNDEFNGHMNGKDECEGSNTHNYLTKLLDIEEFKKHAHTMVDFIADYYTKVESFPVLSQVKPGYLNSLIPDSAPQHPDSVESLLCDVKEKIIPALTHWQSPNFYAYFPAGLSTASFMGEMLSSGLAIVCLTWMTSPAATELETIVCDWLGKMLNLPEPFLSSSGKGGGVIQGSASEAVLVSLLAARNKALKKFGTDSVDKLVVYISDQTHCSIEKACKIAGISQNNLRVLPTSSFTNYALFPEIVAEFIMKDISDGLHPTFLCATIGTTSSTAVDPLQKLAKLAREHDMWFHVDGAYGGAACICPEYQHYLVGVEDADSFDMNPHKWLFTNFDCSILWVKDSKALVEALSMNPEYLTNKVSQSQQVIDYKDWQIPLGSRFRSLKVWMVLRLYGISKLQTFIRYQISLAQHFESLVINDYRFEVMAPCTFALVCFRILPLPNDSDNGRTLNSRLLDAVNDSGLIYLSHTVLSGKYALRFCVGAALTNIHHVNGAWKLLQDQATILLRENN